MNNKIVEYNKTKNHYIIIDDNALMKDPSSGEWINCVIYKNYKEYTQQGYIEINKDLVKTFVREKKDFMEKFSLCLDL